MKNFFIFFTIVTLTVGAGFTQASTVTRNSKADLGTRLKLDDGNHALSASPADTQASEWDPQGLLLITLGLLALSFKRRQRS